MKMLYRINDLIDNVNTVFPTMPEYQNEDWYQQLARHFDDVLECDYWHRIINRLVDKDDFVSLLNFVQKKIKLYLYTNEYKVSKLYETTQFEYNPLWNVDGTETRELSREITGEDTDTFNETNTLAKTGSDTTSNSGYNELVKTGTNTSTSSKTTMNSSTFYDTDKTVEQPNTTDRNNLNSSEQTSYNSTNTDSHTGTVSNEKSNTESLTETTTRQGNIGVTKTTELIESQRQIVNFNFINYICHEIVNEFTILVD